MSSDIYPNDAYLSSTIQLVAMGLVVVNAFINAPWRVTIAINFFVCGFVNGVTHADKFGVTKLGSVIITFVNMVTFIPITIYTVRRHVYLSTGLLILGVGALGLSLGAFFGLMFNN
jgi:hypothetical protein